jgi:membrane protein implicated in regulation of membrane protease activity
MDIIALLEGLTLWHWIGLAILLLTLEVAVGTFDLLWIAIAAFFTAAFAALAPDGIGGWQGQLVFFGLVAVAFVAAGRTIFKGLRKAPSSHPNLNAPRTQSMVGQRAISEGSFEPGSRTGRVRIGDTLWRARVIDDSVIMDGDSVVIVGAEGTTLNVKLV